MSTYISREWTMAEKAAAKNKIVSFARLYDKIKKEFDADSTFDSQPDKKLEKMERAVWSEFFTYDHRPLMDIEGDFPSAAECARLERMKQPRRRPRQILRSTRPTFGSRPSNPSTAGGIAANQTGESSKPAGAEKVTKELAEPAKDTPQTLAEPPKDPSKSDKPVCTFFFKGAHLT